MKIEWDIHGVTEIPDDMSLKSFMKRKKIKDALSIDIFIEATGHYETFYFEEKNGQVGEAKTPRKRTPTR